MTQLREFAERILFGATLEDKLALPGRLDDSAPGPARAVPRYPSRPPELALDGGRVRGRFPGARELERPRRRGEVLHFFANHELLALELMALMLLRFPDAPADFRLGLVGVMVDEQRHMQLYLERMAGCGVALGELPVSDFFWRCLAQVGDLQGFLAGMSLTFEQANLDYSLYYGRAFAAAGDAQTAEVLRRVYEDEVRHVRHGLRWFRRWKPAGMDDFQAQLAVTPAPLSPARARGVDPSREARLEAGFDEAYLSALDVYSRSVGRPPVVRRFEPACELQVAAGRAVTPPAAVQALAEDLETLPMFLGPPDDVVLVRRAPDPGFLAGLKAAGFLPAEFAVGVEALAGRKLGGLEPWGWGPAARRDLGPLAAALVGGAPGPGRWPALYGKDRAAAIEAALLEGWDEDWLGGSGGICQSTAAVEAALARAERAVIKAPFAASGRGLLRWRGRWEEGQRAWVEAALERWGRVVVEPWLTRVLELSILLRVDGERVRRLGFGRSLVDDRGQYKGSVVGPLRRELPRELLRELSRDGRDPRRLERAADRIAEGVGAALLEAGFYGPAGVDTMLWRDGAGRLRLRPVLEINPRTTMGHLALALERRLAPGTVGVSWIASAAQARRTGRDLPGLAASLGEGTVALTDPARARRFVLFLTAGASLVEIRERLARAGVRLPAL